MVLVLAFTAWSISSFQSWAYEQPVTTQCETYLRAPHEGWYKIENCTLEVKDAVLEGSNGEFERLDNRRQGLSTKLYDAPPKWVAAIIPITVPFDRVHVARRCEPSQPT